ncbi:MAG: flagellar biosynthetic protein FliR [Caulobacteraceae bacterium]|nr:flagellar biosynthetic protein FliR [Caulobacteraceae bacterium]
MEHYATAQQVWAAGMVLFRVGSMVMVMPGIGETAVPARIRLSFALLLALCLGPIVAPSLPAVPDSVGTMAGYVFKEVLIGLMIGGILRLFLTAMTTTGELVSLQTTLAFSQTANPLGAQPSTSLSVFLNLMGVVLVFDTDLHQMFLAAIVHSYSLFPPIKHAPIADAAQLAEETVGKSFALAVQLAAPILIFSLVFNVAVGLVGRVMPQFQIFFAATPLTLLLGLSLFALSLGAIGLVWTQAYEALLHYFV